MKKTLALLFLPYLVYSQSSLIFSEYGEGTSYNKWIEIYNPTLQSVYLDEYRYNFCWNGCDSLEWEFSIPFDSGYILLPGETYLLAHYNSDSLLLNTANQTTNILSNGNDVAALLHIPLNTIIDIIGVFDSSSNIIGWDIGTTINATKDHTLKRKTNVCSGNFGDWSVSNGSTSPSEWIVGIEDDFTNLNTHYSNCISTSINNTTSSEKKLLEVRDLLGRKNTSKQNILLYIYSDGTVKKIIQAE